MPHPRGAVRGSRPDGRLTDTPAAKIRAAEVSAALIPKWALDVARNAAPAGACFPASSAPGPLCPDHLRSCRCPGVGSRRDPLLTVIEAAELLQVSTRTIRRLTASGALRAVRVGRAVRLRIAEIERFLASSEAP